MATFTNDVDVCNQSGAIHGKLYHREQEKAVLDALYSRVKDPIDVSNSHFVVIHGPTGVGKSALAEALRPAVVKDAGYFEGQIRSTAATRSAHCHESRVCFVCAGCA